MRDFILDKSSESNEKARVDRATSRWRSAAVRDSDCVRAASTTTRAARPAPVCVPTEAWFAHKLSRGETSAAHAHGGAQSTWAT